MRIEFNTKTKRIVLLEPVTLKELLELRKYFLDLDNWEISGKITEVQSGLDTAAEKRKIEREKVIQKAIDKWKKESVNDLTEIRKKGYGEVWNNRGIESPTVTLKETATGEQYFSTGNTINMDKNVPYTYVSSNIPEVNNLIESWGFKPIETVNSEM